MQSPAFQYSADDDSTVIEDLAQLPPHQKMPQAPEQAEGQLVLHAVSHLGPAGHRPELVPVVPAAIWSRHHPVGECRVLHVLRDHRLPAEGHAVEPQAVLDARALADLGVADGRDPEVQPGRRERAEIVGVLEEPERLGERPRQELAALQDVAQSGRYGTTRSGVARLVVDPSPTWPRLFEPQQ